MTIGNLVLGAMLVLALCLTGCTNTAAAPDSQPEQQQATPQVKPECVCPVCVTGKAENTTGATLDKQTIIARWQNVVNCANECEKFGAVGIAFNITNSTGGASQCACRMIINGRENLAQVERLR